MNWAKNQWPDGPHNLASLGELINDEAFQLAIKELEQVLYAKKTDIWSGRNLLTAFQRIKKSRKYLDNLKSSNHELIITDPLPPLNPS